MMEVVFAKDIKISVSTSAYWITSVLDLFLTRHSKQMLSWLSTYRDVVEVVWISHVRRAFLVIDTEGAHF